MAIFLRFTLYGYTDMTRLQESRLLQRNVPQKRNVGIDVRVALHILSYNLQLRLPNVYY